MEKRLHSSQKHPAAAYLGEKDTFDRAIADFAQAYAEVNRRDHQVLVAAIEEGAVKAQTGL